jgi:hypothetical protein
MNGLAADSPLSSQFDPSTTSSLQIGIVPTRSLRANRPTSRVDEVQVLLAALAPRNRI